MFFKYSLIWLQSVFRQTFVASKCGHTTKVKGGVAAFGERIVTTMPVGKDGRPEYCLKCIEKMAIRCSRCGKAIFVGDPIALLLDDKALLGHVITARPGTRYRVSCLRIGCADSAADRAGFWMPPGVVESVASPYEMIIGDSSECVVLIRDSADKSDVGEVIRV